MIPDSRKWVKDSLTIITDHDYNIDPRLRNKHKAKIIVTYTFGECIFNSIVRQSGDWKDHINMSRGQIVQSVDVKLIDGNINGITRFKLLIPKTRKNPEQELLFTKILTSLNFLAPRTFFVNVNLNNTDTRMLFQEKIKTVQIYSYHQKNVLFAILV